ncbi:Replication protein O [Burkholderia arboris]|uniref:Replication protein O n=1 Tax=Burkholderia arboris TaxID=488730 RepID=UPI001CF26825|nr:Replication protein O [Burkholderia arboris]MCA8037112.1 Replication protein O [Burkholderia arboris]
MSIAQHSVAGEDVAHLQAGDADALIQFSSDTTNLPWKIFRAVHRANQVPQLPARARAVLAALARTVDADKPSAAIFAGRELLTGRALQSTRTFYRSLTDLEAAGLITRQPQGRYAAVGKFGRAYLHLTEAAAQILGLTADEVPVADAAAREADKPAPLPDAFLTRPHAKMAHGRIQGDLSPSSFQKRQPGQLPRDLERLLDLGLHRFMIFKLMGEASRAGTRLSDVVEHTWHHLKAAKNPLAYLRKLITVPTDYSHAVRAKQAEQAAAEVAEQAAEEAAELARRCAGQTFYAPDASRRFDVAPDATRITMTAATDGVPRDMGLGWQQAFADALRTRKAVRETPDLVARYDAAVQQCRPRAAAAVEQAALVPRALSVSGGANLAEMKKTIKKMLGAPCLAGLIRGAQI